VARLALNSWFSFRRMKVWQKCALIAAPFLLPVAGLLYLVIAQNNEQIKTAKEELKGLEYLRPVKQVVTTLATHRGLSNRVLNGDATAEAERTKAAQAVDEAIREVDAADAKYGAEFKTTEKWTAVKDGWKATRAASGQPAAVFAQHTDLIAKALEVSSDVWEYSTLALDPVADTYYLQDIMIARGIPGMEDLGQLRGLSAGIAARSKGGSGKLTDAERLKLNVLLGALESTNVAIEKEAKNAARANAALKGKVEPLADEVKAKVSVFVTKVRPVVADEGEKTTASDLFATGTDAIAALNKLYDGYDPLLTDLLQKRAGGYQQTNLFSIIGTVLALVVVAGVAFLVSRGITRQVGNLTSLFNRVEAGDYATAAAVLSEDELGRLTGQANATLERTTALIQSADEKDQIQRSVMKLLDEVGGVADGDLTKEAEVTADMTGAIADSFNYMIDQLRKIISNVQSATIEVSTAATQIQASAVHLAGGADNQAGQITGTSVALEEMAASIRQVSESAANSTGVAQQALQTARQGNQAVKNTIDGMGRIRDQAQETAKRIKRLGETTQEIGQIVQLIDDIADRTSILALNASIQAAAAGDAGRGFAVVAEEVERLAVRSTEATKKITTLVRSVQGETNEAVAAMEKSIQEVVSGSKVAAQAGQSLNDIEAVSMKLAELIQSISLAAKQQARGSDELSRSMTGISQITQQTAAGTKQTAESVDSLAQLADELRESVSRFRLPAAYQAVAMGSMASRSGRMQRVGV
jgi:twitching motility protein PilJ